MYHINAEGKVYPCRAKVRKCPYGEASHAKTKGELYSKSMHSNPNIEIPYSVKEEIVATGRLKNLYPLSPTLEHVSYPIELIVTNLEYAINHVKDTDPNNLERKWNRTIEEASQQYAIALKNNADVTHFVPNEVIKRGREIFKKDYGRIRSAFTTYDKKASEGTRALKNLREMSDELNNYIEYKKFGLTNENKAGSVGWMEDDFYQFSHDLNTSKMITRPIFHGSLDSAKEAIKNLDDYELLGTYDDYLISDKEIMDNVHLANNFRYTDRQDLSPKANENIRKWYDRNQVIVNDWVGNAPKRVLLSMEMAKELDSRKILRQENAVANR